MFTLFKRAVENWLLPPGILLLMLAAGVLLWGRRPRLAKGLILSTLVLGYLLATPAFIKPLVRMVETWPALSDEAARRSGAEAIVILGSGRYRHAPEYGGEDTLSGGGLARVRYGARLHRLTGLPVLVSGGSPYDEPESEAAIMKRVLEEDFRVPVRWTEGRSRNTWENAQFSREMLQREGIGKVLLATHSNHMARAVESFRQAGLAVVAAPTMLPVDYDEAAVLDWMPHGYDGVRYLAHELAGRLWYRGGGN
ncbi:MAG: YdcF family protein [Magnetococcales bacterium]|nr:YdcF family protein [Magnetococcales bacterium]